MSNTTTDIAVLDAELAKEAQNIKTQIAAPTSPKLSIDKNGSWVAPDGRVFGEEIRGVVVDFVSANRFYDRPYDPSNPMVPACFAIGKALADMKPSANSPTPQHDGCADCQHNQFGSRGNGKACKNTREVAFMLESDFEDANAPLYLISVPPTGLKAFDSFVNAAARLFDGPPLKAVISVRVVAQATYFTMNFVDIAPNAYYKDFVAMRGEALDMLTREPDTSQYVPLKTARPTTARR